MIILGTSLLLFMLIHDTGYPKKRFNSFFFFMTEKERDRQTREGPQTRRLGKFTRTIIPIFKKSVIILECEIHYS